MDPSAAVDPTTITIPPPPPGMNYIAAIGPSVNFIILVTSFASTLVPVMVMMLVFSNPQSRKQAVFWMNMAACLFGILIAILNFVIELQQLLEPLIGTTRQMYLSLQVLMCIGPLLVDSVLLVRVLAFYPPRTTSQWTLVKILAFPILVKAGRLSVEIAYQVKFDKLMREFQTVVLASEIMWFRNPYSVADWTLQVLDNSYCSLFFMYKLRLFDQVGRSGWAIRHPTVLSRIRGLFYIAVGNFVFPIAINIAQIILVVSDRSFLNGGYLQIVNIYVSIIGLVFATIWTTGHRWNSSGTEDSGASWTQYDSSGYSKRSANAKPVNIRLRHETTVQSDAVSSVPGVPQMVHLSSESYELSDVKEETKF